MSLQLAQKPEGCWAPTGEICAAWRKLDCKAIQTGGGALYLATENFNQGVELSVNVTAGIFLKATGSQKQSKQHNYTVKSKTIYMSLQEANAGNPVWVQTTADVAPPAHAVTRPGE